MVINLKPNTLEKIFNKLSLFGVSFCGALIGIIIIILAPKVRDYQEILETIGQTITSISLSSILIEWFGYVNYTRNRLSEILVEDEVLSVLDMKRKRELKSALIRNIYMPNQSLEENNIATIVDDEMDKILKEYYYEEYILYIDAYIKEIDGNKYLKKDIRITFTAKSVSGKKCTLEKLLNAYLEPPSNGIEPVHIKKLLINDKNCLEYVQSTLPSKNNDDELRKVYSKIYHLDKSNKRLKGKLVFKDSIDVDMEYSTVVNLDDIIYSNQIDRACKHYCIHFNVKPDEYDIIMEGFGFMSLGNSKRQRMIKTNNGYMLRFLDWILPGDGVIVILKEK